jgi:Tol biopolymer transport system component/putative hemolysin
MLLMLPREVKVKKRTLVSLGALIAMLFASYGCTQKTPTPSGGLPNPASVYCEQNGGTVELRADAAGAIAGTCVFPDGSECDEWSYYRGVCKPGESLTVTPETEVPSPSMPAATSAPSGSPTRSPAGGGSGVIAFYSNRGAGYDNVYALQTGDRSVVPLTNNENNTFSGPYSPDAARLLFTGFGLTHSYVGLMNADGSGQTDLTNLPESDQAFPAWSPDGALIAFTSRRDGNNEIYTMNADGSGARRRTNNPKDDFAPAWSPDGTKIAFVSDRDNQTGIYSLYMMNADGSGVTRLTHDKSSDYAPDWSPDGARLAYYSIRDGQADIYVIDSDGSNEVDLTNNPADDYAPRWSPDGSLLAFQTNRDGNWEIYVMDADGSQPVDLSNNPSDDQSPFWQP